MKHKFLTALLCLASALCLCLGIAACDETKETPNTPTIDSPASDPNEKNPSHTHSFTNYVYNDDATCTKDGTETATCSCGEKDTRTKAGTKLGHSFVNYVSNGDATCTEDGTETATCERCTEKDTRTKTGSKLGHNLKTKEGKAPTCVEAGWEAYQACSRCDYETPKQAIPATGKHTYRGGKCTVCGQLQAVSEGLTYRLDGTRGYIVTGIGDCKDTNLVIPGTYKNLPVIGIENYAFYECASITSVTIGENVTSIGTGAFGKCRSLTSIEIPESVIEIRSLAFDGCTSLTSATFAKTDGWSVSQYGAYGPTGKTEAIESKKLQDPATAALYLRSTYCRSHSWERK